MNLTEKLRQGYAPGVPYFIDSGETLLSDLLFDSAARYPDRAAIDFLSQQTTYADLARQVRQAATVLRDHGVKRGDHIALIMPNCPQHAVALFAIALVGAVSIEHNPLAPSDELKSEFARHQAKTVIAWENAVEKLSFLGPDAQIFGVNLAYALSRATRLLLRLPLKSVKEKKRVLGASVPDHVLSWDRTVREAEPWMGDATVHADDPAVMLHTSGTTGLPKAAVLSHRNLASNVAMACAWVPPLHEGAEVFYAILPFFHAYGLTVSLMAGISLGATIGVFPKFDVSQVLLSQKRLPCTFFVGVPPMLDRLLAEGPGMNADFTSIKFTVSGAMPLSEELSKRWEEATAGYTIEGYGMTEASPIILGSPLSHDRRPGALGLPWPSTEVRIVDPENPEQDVKEGEVGELIARGPQVFTGYLNEPDETAHTLRDGWLFTGDLVQVRDGYVYMEDRRKELILSGGFNVYPSQVEDVVRAMPGVQDVAVVGMPGGSKGEEVVAALVLEGGASVTLADVQAWAEKSLARYALPRQIVVLQELPKSQIGKVMRRTVQQQITELQSGLGQRFPSLATSASELGKQASELSKQMGTVAAAARDSVTAAAAGASEKAAALLARSAGSDDERGQSSADSDVAEGSSEDSARNTMAPQAEETAQSQAEETA